MAPTCAPALPTLYLRFVHVRAGRSRAAAGRQLLLAAFGAALFAFAAAPAARAAPAYAPLNEPGPPITIPQAKLDASLQCTAGVANASRAPVLLNPATGVTAEQNYSWNWEKSLSNQGIP